MSQRWDAVKYATEGREELPPRLSQYPDLAQVVYTLTMLGWASDGGVITASPASIAKAIGKDPESVRRSLVQLRTGEIRGKSKTAPVRRVEPLLDYTLGGGVRSKGKRTTTRYVAISSPRAREGMNQSNPRASEGNNEAKPRASAEKTPRQRGTNRGSKQGNNKQGGEAAVDVAVSKSGAELRSGQFDLTRSTDDELGAVLDARGCESARYLLDEIRICGATPEELDQFLSQIPRDKATGYRVAAVRRGLKPFIEQRRQAEAEREHVMQEADRWQEDRRERLATIDRIREQFEALPDETRQAAWERVLSEADPRQRMTYRRSGPDTQMGRALVVNAAMQMGGVK